MTTGLIVFITVIVIDVCGLLVDLVLDRLGLTTITKLVKRGNWALGGVIVGIQVIGALGLAEHFWYIGG